MALSSNRWLLANSFLAVAAAAAGDDLPFWPHYGGKRQATLLDGSWKFGLHVDPKLDSMSPGFDPADVHLTPNLTNVPSSFDAAEPGIAGPRGVAVYRKSFKQSGRARLQFYGCSFYCRVFVDGTDIGDHRAGGYVPFWLDVEAPAGSGVRGAEPMDREIVVLADNRFNRTTAPMHYNGGDFWHYGGLIRSVVLYNMPAEDDVWVWRAYVFPKSIEDGIVDIQVMLTDPKATGPCSVSVSFDIGSVTVYRANASAGSLLLTGVSVPEPRLWSLEDPQLHTVTVTVNGGEVVERFGLRVWGVDSTTNRITLNGKVVKLHGWNHHTQWPDTGASPTTEQLEEDLALLKDGGANYVRGAHYPQDQRWLDRLDEMGFAMWEEAMAVGVPVSDFQDWDFFMKHQLIQMNEMLDASMNHASIMTWGFFNEGHSEDVRSCPAYEASAKLAKSRDPTRFQTWASNRIDRDECLDYASLISFNGYPAWYGNVHNLSYPKTFWGKASRFVRSKFPSTPWVISETGAGGVYEWAHNTTDALWTQWYQTEIISAEVDIALADDSLSGITLWHFFDFKGNDQATADCGPCDYLEGVEPPTCAYINVSCHRPGGKNHKGAVDFYRRLKQPYPVVAEKYKKVGEPRDTQQLVI